VSSGGSARGPAPASTGPVRVAVLGGGCGGLAAAWALSATPELRERFDVTVYQLGWRLGGKGASGRMPHDSRDGGRGYRIEEHGLHIWFGFYERAFRMLRQAYDEAELAAGEDWWTTPFQRCNSVSLYERRDDGSWVRQPVGLPPRGGSRAGPPTESKRTPFATAVARATRILALGLRSDLAAGERRRGAAPDADDPVLADALATLDELAGELDRVPAEVPLSGEVSGYGVWRGVSLRRRPEGGYELAAIEQLVGRLREHVRQLRDGTAGRALRDRLRLWSGVLEMVAATLAGIVRDGLLWRGLGVLDNEDLREWLGRHGVSSETLERSPVLRGLYDLTFAYRHGDKRNPSLAAGKGLQSLLMMINYDGAFMWRMRAGMGDVVFSPLYLALKERGVSFNFFSRVSGLRLAAGRPIIDAIELVREATVTAGADRYDPVELIEDWWCWPGEPRREQLADTDERPETLVCGEDFDEVVLAIPVGAQHDICRELAVANPRYKQMLDGSETVRTKALQLWLTRPIEELRGAGISANGRALDPPATAYAEPFDTYCDMSHLLEVEGCAEDGPKALAYFCAVLRDETSAAAAEEAVRAEAREYIEREAKAFWPGAFNGDEFDWSVLFDPHDRVGPDRLLAQYVRANVEPTDRYVTTPSGSVDSRLDPGASGFENLVLAGDWTHNDIDGGCVEAAVISGELAGAALIEADEARRGRVRQAPAATAEPTRRGGGELATGAPRATRTLPRYVEYGALATAPGPLMCERTRLYCFFLNADRARVQQLCDRVLKEPTGGALRYRVPRLAPVILSFGTIGGLRSLDPGHSGRGSAFEPEAAIWVPTIAQHLDRGAYVDDHLAIFMPYIWVDDPIAFAAGREVYGFAKTQGWMRELGDPRNAPGGSAATRLADPPEEMYLDVYGTAEYHPGAELGRTRLITIRRGRGATRGAAPLDGPVDDRRPAEGGDFTGLLEHFVSALDPGAELPDLTPARRSAVSSVGRRLAGAVALGSSLSEFLSEQVVRHVFLKQFRDAEHGQEAVLQQVVEARSSVTPDSLRWRRMTDAYSLSIESLESQPLADELGIDLRQTTRLAFAAEFGFRMESGVVVWPGA
jgi:uncharacterized protein with NAD-binding domain and iron-sulfur cluster